MSDKKAVLTVPALPKPRRKTWPTILDYVILIALACGSALAALYYLDAKSVVIANQPSPLLLQVKKEKQDDPDDPVPANVPAEAK